MSSRSGKTGSRARRKNALGVCSTCRRRHIKCDLVRPICGGCKAIGSACEAVEPDLIWQATTTPSQKRHRSPGSTPLAPRRHLYTDRDRVSMTIDLQSSLQTRSVDDSLQEIDDGSEAALLSGQSSFVGPFGILSLQKADAPLTPNEHDETDVSPIVDSASAIELDPLPTDLFDLSNLQNVEEFLNWPDLFDIDLSWSDLSFDDISTPPNQWQPPSAIAMENTIEQNRDTALVNNPKDVNVSPPPDFSLGNVQIPEAQMLLRRYKDIVVAHSFSFPIYGTSPWEALNIDAAVITMGRISFMGVDRVSHAAMSNLLALIAVSSAHKAAGIRNQGTSGAEHWEKVSMDSYARGKDHLQRSLKSETHVNPPPKYKEQMMAISAMLQFAVSGALHSGLPCLLI